MKFKLARAAVVSIGTSLLLLSGIRCSQAAEISVVSPHQYADSEAPDRTGGNHPEAARQQGIAHRSEFDALPVGGAWLTEIRYRPDGAVPVGEVISFGRVQFSLSVTQVDPLHMSFTFADNITGTPVVVYNAAWSSTVVNPEPLGAATRPFDFRIPLETPYFYNPAEGNLLYDIIREMPGPGNGLAISDLDLSDAFSEKQDIWSEQLGVDSPVSFLARFTSINEFVFIPSSPGDFNNDGTVDAADYVVWRKGLGTIYALNDYNIWRALFGQTVGSGSGASASADVPEPATLLMLMMGAASIRLRRRQIA